MFGIFRTAARTTNDVLTTVSATSQMVSTTAMSGAEAAAVLHATTVDWRETHEQLLQLDKTERLEMRKHERASTRAEFYMDLDERFERNPKLKKYYLEALKAYDTIEATPQLKATA